MNTADVPAARACGGCGVGMLRPTDVAGMVMDHRDDPNVRIEDDLILPVCDVCGDMTFTEEQAGALDDALERSYQQKRLRTREV